MSRPLPARWGLTAALVLAFLALAASPSAAIDDYVLGSPADGYMPDFDQRRQPGPLVFDGMSFIADPPGLPNNGAMYCVPTASIDVMAYLANHGYPELMPGAPLDWQSQEYYELVNGAIAQMGDFMDTHPVDGTLGKGASGTREWFDTYAGPDVFIVDSKWAKNAYGPNVWELANAANSGQIVIMNVGWYSVQPGGQYLRVGGHQTVLTSATQNDGFFVDGCEVGFRDPGGGGDLQTQSTFANRTATIDYVFGQFSSSSDPVAYTNRTMAQLVGYGSPGFIQGFYRVTPVFGVAPNGPILDFFNPFPVGPDPLPLTQSFTAPEGAEIVDIAVHPAKIQIYYTVRDAAGAVLPGVRCVDKMTGESVVAIPGIAPTRMVFGDESYLFVADGNCVETYDTALPSAPLVATECLPGTITALAHVSPIDALLIINAAEFGARRLGPETGLSPLVPFPTTVDLPGEVLATTDPETGDLWIRGSESAIAYRLAYDPGTTDPTTGGGTPPSFVLVDSFVDPSLVGATSFEASAGGRLYSVVGGVVRVHGQNSAGGWTEIVDSPFAGLASSGKFAIARPVDNSDLDYRTDPSHRNLLPVEGERAFERGDCNGDQAFDIADAIRTLAFLFSGDAEPNCLDACDANDDGAADIGDAVYSLSALFSGGDSPPAPFAECGVDLTADTLECTSYDCP